LFLLHTLLLLLLLLIIRVLLTLLEQCLLSLHICQASSWLRCLERAQFSLLLLLLLLILLVVILTVCCCRLRTKRGVSARLLRCARVTLLLLRFLATACVRRAFCVALLACFRAPAPGLAPCIAFGCRIAQAFEW
jgi:hypothetical protein